ncbi:hypothetical protein BC827DRAFT_1294551 [Russula dissimulans]|nr:hypothetical protein BC827DRAFT_1294551 [Russula dissimulans]
MRGAAASLFESKLLLDLAIGLPEKRRHASDATTITVSRISTRNTPTRFLPYAVITAGTPLSLSPRRGYASESTSPPPPQGPPLSFKPKAHTSLRRTAADSLPIRANPKPTRSEIQPISTLATAERYVLERLRKRLPSTTRLHDAYWVPKWSSSSSSSSSRNAGSAGKARDGEVFVFSNGSFVCWGLSEEDAKRFRKEVLEPSRAEVGSLAEPETEELEFAMDPSEQTRLQGDLIILGGDSQPTDPENPPGSFPPSVFPQETVLVRYAFSQALSRSTALSALETSLEGYLSSMSSLPLALEKTGKPDMSRRELVKKLGGLLRFRQGLNLNRENFSETPDFYWDRPPIRCCPSLLCLWANDAGGTGYFNSLTAALEVKARTRAVNDKITYAAEVQSVLRQLLHETSSARMELVIIALIAVEVIIALIRDVPELFQWEANKRPKRRYILW